MPSLFSFYFFFFACRLKNIFGGRVKRFLICLFFLSLSLWRWQTTIGGGSSGYETNSIIYHTCIPTCMAWDRKQTIYKLFLWNPSSILRFTSNTTGYNFHDSHRPPPQSNQTFYSKNSFCLFRVEVSFVVVVVVVFVIAILLFFHRKNPKSRYWANCSMFSKYNGDTMSIFPNFVFGCR